MTMTEAIDLVESVGGMARQPARSTALAAWVNTANVVAFDRVLTSIQSAGLTIIVCRSREMFDG
jgi:hypothetical protein